MRMHRIRTFSHQFASYEDLCNIARPGALLTALLDKSQHDLRGFPFEVNSTRLGRMAVFGRCYRGGRFLAHFVSE